MGGDLNYSNSQRMIRWLSVIGEADAFSLQKDIKISAELLANWITALESEIQHLLADRIPLEPGFGITSYEIMGKKLLMDYKGELDSKILYLEALREMAASAQAVDSSVRIVFINSMEEASEELKKIDFAKRNKN